MVGNSKKIRLRLLLGIVLIGSCLLLGSGVYNVYKPLPDGISYAGQVRPVEEITFYKDLTWVDGEGTRHSHQEIFNKVLKMIANARYLIVLDMFLFNDFIDKEQVPYRRIVKEVTDALVAQKKKYPDMQIVVITDPINTIYKGMKNSYFEKMTAENIQVIFTKLERLRDSNPVYSVFWRVFARPFGNSPASILPSPFGKGRVSLRSYLTMINFKANHRKLIICHTADGYSALITSANPHDGSSAHGNVAIYFKGPAVLDLLQTERAVLAFSGGPSLPHNPVANMGKPLPGTTVQILTERKIKETIITVLNEAEAGAKLAMMAFYLSDRDVIAALKKAYRRGAAIRILLDPNKDAFGRKKNGIPNRQVADELTELGIPVRWSDTHGEQSHTKMLLVEDGHGRSIVILGSANFTRRNLNNLNLETNIAVRGPATTPIFIDINNYINIQWSNTDGKKFSVDYSDYADKSFHRRILYHWMERTGMSTF